MIIGNTGFTPSINGRSVSSYGVGTCRAEILPQRHDVMLAMQKRYFEVSNPT
jgi:hypothetical protein